jgi:hypothetical protein
MFDRADLPEFAKPRSPTAGRCRWQRIRLVILPFLLLCCLAAPSNAAENLECPEIGPGHVPNLIGDTTCSGLVTTENRAELVNEVNYLINKLQITDPNNLVNRHPKRIDCRLLSRCEQGARANRFR